MNLTEKQEVSGEVIEQFLAGSNPMKYVVAIEPTYHTNKVDLIINDPFLIKSLPKNLVLYDEFESLQDDIEISKSNISIRKCYNEFPSLQRKLLDRLILIKKEFRIRLVNLNTAVLLR